MADAAQAAQAALAAQNAAEQALAQAQQAANQANHQARARALDLPQFKGDKSDLTTPEAFLARVELARRLGNWNDERTAEYVLLACTGKASATWVENLEANEIPGRLVWTDNAAQNIVGLKTLFRRRFMRPSTFAEKAALMSTLKLKADETVLSFLDRINAAQRIFEDDMAPVPQAQKAIYDIMKDRQILLNFTAGLPQKMQDAVILSGANTLAEVTGAAVRSETSTLNARKSSGNALKGIEIADLHEEMEDALTEQEIEEAISSLRFQKRQQRAPARQSGGGRPAQPQQGQERPPPGRYKDYKCDHCDKMGHISKFCFQRKREGKPLLPRPPQARARVNAVDGQAAAHDRDVVDSLAQFQLFDMPGEFGNDAPNQGNA